MLKSNEFEVQTSKMNCIERQFGVLITRFAFVYKVFISSVCCRKFAMIDLDLIAGL